MRKTQKPPVNVPMLDKNGVLNSVWQRWFDTVATKADTYRQMPDLSCSVDTTLTTDDFGKVVLFDCTTSHLTCTLPPVTSKDLNCWITIWRKGNNRLTIVPPATTRIEHGSYGGRVFCHEEKRAAANLTLQLISVTQWGITGGTGVWKTA